MQTDDLDIADNGTVGAEEDEICGEKIVGVRTGREVIIRVVVPIQKNVAMKESDITGSFRKET